MQVKFRTKKLQKQYEQRVAAVRAYGEDVGKRYVQRIGIIKAARSLDDLMKAPGLKCHPLTGDRKGQWAITLIDRARLIFTFEDETLSIVCIEEVSKHYGD